MFRKGGLDIVNMSTTDRAMVSPTVDHVSTLLLGMALLSCVVGSSVTAIQIGRGMVVRGRLRWLWVLAASGSLTTAIWTTRLLTLLAFERSKAIFPWLDYVPLLIGLTALEATGAFALLLFRPSWRWSPAVAGAGLGFSIGTAPLFRIYRPSEEAAGADHLIFIGILVVVGSMALAMALDFVLRPASKVARRRALVLLTLALGMPIVMVMTALSAHRVAVTAGAHPLAMSVPAAWMAVAIAASGGILLLLGFVVTARDETMAHYEEQARLYQEKAAHYDALTELPRASFLEEQLNQVLSGALPERRFACLCVSPFWFTAIGEAFGPRMGDAVLVAVVERLQQITRGTDVVGRFGSDEFVILQQRSNDPDSVTTFAERVIDTLDKPFMIEGEEIVAGASVGIALHPDDGGNAELLLRSAHIALGFAKADGRGRWRFFEPEMDELMVKRRTLERDLEKAFRAGRLTLQYQPLFDCKTRQITGFEALTRWTHPSLGEVPPSEFIPVAEGSGLIGRLGLWVLETACADATLWPSTIGVAVNVSPLQLHAGDFVAATRDILERTGLAPERLELEVTESALIDNPDQSATLKGLKRLGVRLAIDDFGAGYSSLSYLRLVSFDSIKIDRSFVEGLETDKDTAIIVRAIISLGHSLRLTVTAEGVETPAQLRRVCQHGCDQVQGYLLGRPMPITDTSKLLTKPAPYTLRLVT